MYLFIKNIVEHYYPTRFNGYSMQRNIRIAIIGFLLCSILKSSAQEPAYTHYTVDDGLSNLTVYSSMQDSKGNIWFSTSLGVSMFNGYEFINYNTKDGLSDDIIFKTVEDSKGRIWFMSYNGSFSYHLDGQIYNSSMDSSLRSVEFTRYTTMITEDASGDLWFGSFDQGASLITASGEYQKMNIIDPELLNTNRVVSILPLPKGQDGVLFLLNKGFVQMVNNKVIKRKEIDITMSAVMCKIYDSKYLVSSKNNLIIYDAETNEYQILNPHK